MSAQAIRPRGWVDEGEYVNRCMKLFSSLVYKEWLWGHSERLMLLEIDNHEPGKVIPRTIANIMGFSGRGPAIWRT